MKQFILPLFAFFIIFSGCKSKSDSISLIESNLTEEIGTTGNFEFIFSEALVADTMLYFWDSTDYVKFSPEIPGAFKWTSGNVLVFSPMSELPPATEYTASASSKLNGLGNVTVEPITFRTPLLQLESTNMFWDAVEGSNSSVAKLDLVFNYKVSPNDINSYLSITSDDKKVNFLSEESDNSQYILSYILEDIEVKDEDVLFNISLEKGLKPSQGNIGTEQRYSIGKLLKSPFVLEITEVKTDHDGTKGTVEVIASQAVSDRSIKDYISFDPKVTFTTKMTDKGFILESESFSLTNKYEMKIAEGLMGKVGGKLRSGYSKDIAFGELEPSISFDHSKGFYLGSKGYQNLGIKIVNVPEVRVRIMKLYETNILAATDYGSYSDYWYDGYDDSYYWGGTQLEDVIYDKTIQTKNLKKNGPVSLMSLDFEDELKDFPGVYHIEIQSTDDYWLQDSRLVSVSDIGLIAKRGQNQLFIFANSLKTTEAQSDVNLKVYGRNNQVIAEGLTGSDGVAKLMLKNKDYSGFTPALITASKGDEFTMLDFRNTDVETSRFDVGGYRSLPNGLQTYIYYERDLYRPGETVNVAGIVRNQNWDAPGKLPIKIEVKMPNGKVLKTIKKTLNGEGSFEISFPTEANNVTGRYSVYVYSSTEVLLSSNSVMIEEFMPDRIKVSTNLSLEELGVNETTNLSVDAQNLFGTPAANRNYEVEISYRQRYFSPDDFGGYTFSIANTQSYFEKDLREGSTDDAGKVMESIEVPESFENMGVLQADIFTTVFDETGRPVNRKNVLNIYTQEHFYGLGYFGYYNTTNNELSIPMVAVDKNGKAQNGVPTRIQIIKHEYKTVLNKNGSSFRYESVQYENELVDKEITINGKQSYAFTPTVSGRYEVRLYNPEVSGKYVSRHFYAYGYGRTYLSSFEVDNEGKVEMEFDKESYEVGETAKILFKTPFQGKLLVTLEGNEVSDHFYVNTDKRSAEVNIVMTENLLPNIYVSATLFKPHEASEFPLTVAHGYESIKIDASDRQIPVEINVVENSRSRVTQTIKVKSYPNSKVTLAIVDEGILQVSGFKTPRPYDYFYQKRALQVSSYDVYPYLYPEISATSAGDDGFDLEKRVNPMKNNRVKLVSFWSGILETDGSGNVSYDIDIPQFSGSLRVMAVSHKGNAFGSADESMIVADPIIISSSIPRFVSPGDTMIVLTTLTNTTDKSTNAKTNISVSGPFEVIGSSKNTSSINSKGEVQESFMVYAKNELGVGKIVVSTDAVGEVFKEETELSIRPASPLLKVNGGGSIAGGSTKSIDMEQKNFMDGTADYKLVVSKNPMVEFGKDLDYLVRYPYGCTEQTISAAFPQLYFNDLSIAMYKDDSKAEEVVNNVTAAINKMKLRQLYNGSLTMWGSGSENWWVTIYGAHFLIEAKKAGFDYDESVLDYCLGYIEKRLQSKETVTYNYNRTQSKKIAPREVAYGLYVLAMADRADVSLMNYYKSNTAILSLDSRYLLAGAYALAGDKVKAKELLPEAYSGEVSTQQFGGSFSSPVRDEAIALNALMEIDPNNDQVGIMAVHVSENLRNSRYLNTQERIFSLLALGKISKLANASTVSAVIKADGKTIGSYSKGSTTLNTSDIAGKSISIDVEGNGKLFYFWDAEGISKDGSFNEEDSYLKVRKSFYDRYGRLVTGNNFKQNDLIVVKLSISGSYNGSVENVVISDILPAGFEIENPRTDDVPGTDWIDDQAYPDHRDIRDDRINIFDDIYCSNGNTQNYYYVVRCVSVGTFKMGPVGADAMYNSEYHSYSGGGTITITK